MVMPYLNYTESPLDLEKFKKKPHNSNLKSFWAFLLSTVLYISVFYVFNLSPSALFFTTKFWFIMSNTLILIIAADSGAFSSTKEHSFYDEYYAKNNIINHPRAKTSTTTTTTTTTTTSISVPVPSFDHMEYVRVDKPRNEAKTKRVDDEESEEKIIAMIAAPDHSNKTADKCEKPGTELIEKNKENLKLICSSGSGSSDETEKGGREAKRRRRRLKRVAFADERREETTVVAAAGKNMTTMMHVVDQNDDDDELEADEFSRMSNEEVNRRVEDFIRRFNNQIRLQAATNRRQHQHYQM